MTLLASSISSFFSLLTSRTWLLSASERAEKSCGWLAQTATCKRLLLPCCGTHLGLARLALVCRDANLIEKTVQLSYTAIDLLGQVAGVHGVRCACAAGDVVWWSGSARGVVFEAKGERSQIYC